MPMRLLVYLNKWYVNFFGSGTTGEVAMSLSEQVICKFASVSGVTLPDTYSLSEQVICKSERAMVVYKIDSLVYLNKWYVNSFYIMPVNSLMLSLSEQVICKLDTIRWMIRSQSSLSEQVICKYRPVVDRYIPFLEFIWTSDM